MMFLDFSHAVAPMDAALCAVGPLQKTPLALALSVARFCPHRRIQKMDFLSCKRDFNGFIFFK
jgi:hypothetical protein